MLLAVHDRFHQETVHAMMAGATVTLCDKRAVGRVAHGEVNCPVCRERLTTLKAGATALLDALGKGKA